MHELTHWVSSPLPHIALQVPRDWHLAVIVLLLTSISIPLAVGESVSQVSVLVRDDENREGRNVRSYS